MNSYIDYDDYDDFYEPSKFDEEIEKFKDVLRNSVKEEIRNEMEKLKKENAELQEIKENFESIKNDYETKKSELYFKQKKVAKDVAWKRLEELFSDCGMNTILYRLSTEYTEKPKCDKCDKNRFIHFKSPSGRDLTEQCECAKKNTKYIPKENCCTEFRLRDRKNLSMWFKPSCIGSCDEDYDSVYVECIGDDKTFEELEECNKYRLFFKSKEKCQLYCDYLNKKENSNE